MSLSSVEIASSKLSENDKDVIPAQTGIQLLHPTWIPYQVRNDISDIMSSR
jgi:hypothetical protein